MGYGRRGVDGRSRGSPRARHAKLDAESASDANAGTANCSGAAARGGGGITSLAAQRRARSYSAARFAEDGGARCVLDGGRAADGTIRRLSEFVAARQRPRAARRQEVWTGG